MNIFVYHFNKLNDFGFGFLVGKIILLFLFGFITYKTYPYTNKK